MKKVFYTFMLAFASCTNIDCPLDNIVVMTSGLYHSEDGSSMKLSNTDLTVTGFDEAYVLLNKANDISSFAIPMRHGVGTDTLLFHFSNVDEQYAVDTVYLTYTDSPHFESIDCPAALFHTLKDVRWTSHPLGELPLTIDKVEIVRSLVDYDDVENLKIYLRSTAQ